MEKEEGVNSIPDFAGKEEEEGGCGCGSIGRWSEEGSLSGNGFAGAPEGEGEFAAGRLHCVGVLLACKCIIANTSIRTGREI